MQLRNYIFLSILILILIIPLYYTVTGKYDFRNKLRYGMPAIFITGFMFLLWDIRFTEVGIWSYDPDYTIGLFHKSLPIEQWLVYFVFPFAALLVYEIIKTRLRSLDFNNVFTAVSLLLVVAFAIVAYLFRVRIYTFFSFLFTTIYLAYTIFRKQFKPNLTRFFLTYFIVLVPYFILNWFLTWNLAIEYHQEQVLNVWIGMVPVENFVYLFLLLLINITVYEYLSVKKYF